MDDYDIEDPSSDYVAGLEDMRMLFFEELRDLIAEKIAANDDIAADVLGWAYERLGEVT